MQYFAKSTSTSPIPFGCFLLPTSFLPVSCFPKSFKSSTFPPDFEQDAPTGTTTLICSSQQKLAGVKSTTQISVYPWEKAKPRGETSLLQEKKSLCWMKGLLQPPLQRHHRQGTSTPWHLHVVLFLERFHSSPSPPCLPWSPLPLLVCFHHTKSAKRQSEGSQEAAQRCSPGAAGTTLLQSEGEQGERWQPFQSTAALGAGQHRIVAI